jgi:ABC-type transporter Mla subunit MlaD
MLSRITMEIKVGVFLVVFAVLAVTAFVYIGVKKDLFAEKVSFGLRAATGETVETGMPVKVSGFRIGRVTDVTMKDVHDIHIRISVKKQFLDWFTAGTKVVLEPALFGQAYLDVIPGPRNASPLQPGHTMHLIRAEDFMERMQATVFPLLRRLENNLNNINRITANVAEITDQMLEPTGEFQRTLQHVERVSASAEAQGLVGAALGDPDRVAGVGRILSNTEDLMARLNSLTGEARSRLAQMASMQASLAELLDTLTAMAAEMRGEEGDVARLRQQAEEALHRTEELLDQAGRTWPLNRPRPEPEPAEHPMP